MFFFLAPSHLPWMSEQYQLTLDGILCIEKQSSNMSKKDGQYCVNMCANKQYT